MTEPDELGAERRGGVVEAFRVGGRRGAGEIESVHVVHGNDVHMGVRDLEAGDHQPHACGPEHRLLCCGDGPGDGEDVGGHGRVEVDPVVDLGVRDDQRVPMCQRVDGEEGHGEVVAPDEPAREFPGDDAGEDARHAGTVAPVGRRSPRVYAHAVRPWTIPNAVSALRLLAVPLFVWLLFGVGDRGAAAWTLAALGATDWVDGFLARRLDQVSELGKVLDPIADRLALVVGIGAIVIDGSAPLLMAGLVLLREAIVSVFMSARTVLRRPTPPVNRLGKTGTFFAYFAFPMWLGGNSTLSYAGLLAVVAWVFAVPGVAAGWLSLLQYVRGGTSAGQGSAVAN